MASDAKFWYAVFRCVNIGLHGLSICHSAMVCRIRCRCTNCPSVLLRFSIDFDTRATMSPFRRYNVIPALRKLPVIINPFGVSFCFIAMVSYV